MYCAIRIMLHCDMGTFVVIYAKVHPCFSNSQAFFCLQRSLRAAGRPTASSHWLPQCPLLGHCLNHSSRPLAGFVSMSHIRAVPVPVPRVRFHTVPVSPVSEDTVPVSPVSDGTPPPPRRRSWPGGGTAPLEGGGRGLRPGQSHRQCAPARLPLQHSHQGGVRAENTTGQ